MQRIGRWPLLPAAVVALVICSGPPAEGACCYFSAKDQDVLQPAQKVFITYDPAKQLETFTVQPKFEGNALDFGMVIPTPNQPKLSEMPRDFFKHLAIYTIMRKREFAHSKLLPLIEANDVRRYAENWGRLGLGDQTKPATKESNDDAEGKVRKP